MNFTCLHPTRLRTSNPREAMNEKTKQHSTREPSAMSIIGSRSEVKTSEFGDHGICDGFGASEFRDHGVCDAFPATEAPGVRLYYKSRLSSHGSPRRTTSVLQKSKKTQKHYGFSTATTRKRAEALRLYVKKRKTRRFWHRDHAKTRRGATFVCQETQKHDGFGTATTRKPAEGLRLYVKKRKSTTVLAPRQRRNPQRVVCAHEKKCQKRRF